jgi:hypothetical protein
MASWMSEVKRAAKKQGITIEPAGGKTNGHLKVTSADNLVTIEIAATPTRRGMLNCISRMRREVGFVWKGH